MKKTLALIWLSAAVSASQAEPLTLAEMRAQQTALADRDAASPQRAGDGNASVASAGYDGEPAGTIVIDTGTRTLHYVVGDGNVISYPVAVGREGAQWSGSTVVTSKKKNPEWRPTPNMRKQNPKLPARVEAGPGNPLGVRAIYLAEGYLRIHGTNNPKSIGTAASSGCFRMYNEDVVDLYERVSPGAKVVVR